MQKHLLMLLTAAAVLGTLGCASSPSVPKDPLFAQGTDIYLAQNLWFENSEKIYMINFHIGEVVPAGTKVVSLTEVNRGKYPSVKVRFDGYDNEFVLFFNRDWQDQRTLRDVAKKIFTVKDFAGLTAGFSEAEVAAIKNAEVVPGMSKEAVVISYGYPPRVLHRLPMGWGRLGVNTSARKPAWEYNLPAWQYWQSRFDSEVVHFDGDGKVVKVED